MHRTAVAGFLLLTAPLCGQSAYSSLGPGGSLGFSVWGNWITFSDLTKEFAWQFQTGATGNVTELRLGLFRVANGQPLYRLSIYDSTGALDDTPGSVLWSEDLTLPAQSGQMAWTLPMAAGPLIEAGERYFISVKALPSPVSHHSWSWYTPPTGAGIPPFPSVVRADRFGADPWAVYAPTVPAAYEVIVPAPAAGWLMAGMGCFAARRRRKRGH